MSSLDDLVSDVIPQKEMDIYRASMGKRVGFGHSIAVIVVDVYRYHSKMAERIIPSVSKLLQQSREANLPIFYTTWQRYDDGSPGAAHDVEVGRWLDKYDKRIIVRSARDLEIIDAIAPQEGDVTVSKAKPSGFFGTQLASLLNYHRIDTLVVTGLVTSGCVRATVVDAFSYNYRVIVPMECVVDRSELSHKLHLFEMDMKYADVMPLADVLREIQKPTQAQRKGERRFN
jgi:nicotinamidase-related amidase